MFFTVLATVLLLLLVVLVAIYIRQTARANRRQPPPPPTTHPPYAGSTGAATSGSGVVGAGASIKNARVGDAILIPGAGDDFSDLNLTVDRRDGYNCGDDRWFEISGPYRGRRVYIEVSEDDTTKVLVNLADEDLTLADLGLTEEQLVAFDENQDRADGFDCMGSRWLYEWSGEIFYHKNESSHGEGFYCWDFREDGGSRELCVEKWEGEPFEVSVSRVVNADDVQVFRS